MPEGTITTHRANRPDRDDWRGFGIIAPDDGGPELFFTSDSVAGTRASLRRQFRAWWLREADRGEPFDRLQRGQRVSFVIGADARRAGRACAERVRPIEVRAGTREGG